MIQDISPHNLDNQYRDSLPQKNSVICCFRGGDLLIARDEEHRLSLPEYFRFSGKLKPQECRYLFAMDGVSYYLALRFRPEEALELEGYSYESCRRLRQLVSKEICFAATVAWHLWAWYRDNRFCGRCGKSLVHDRRLRMLSCPECGLMVFPKIAPAVIICLTDGDRILMSKYANRDFTRYALLAGFTEIGETAEETVAREVMEEVGLKVKNIRYYKSQPWGIDSNLLFGFFCELDGDDPIHMDEEELSLAEWYTRDEMPAADDGISLTREMMGMFARGEV